MTAGGLVKIFLRSFFIQTSFNLRRMQNLGFTYAVMPLLKEKTLPLDQQKNLLTRHLQVFNTHPYLSASIIGSVVHLEEEKDGERNAASVSMIKTSLAGPYAAIGDTFFWGALRPCAGIFASLAAFSLGMLAPLVFMLIYTPSHIWVRGKGFLESYRKGKLGIEFVRKLDLPKISVKVRWISLIIIACYCGFYWQGGHLTDDTMLRLVLGAGWLAVILVCWFLIKKGISQIYILYGATFLAFIFALCPWLKWW